jgi:GNAT superfamily N-acetyltransferase
VATSSPPEDACRLAVEADLPRLVTLVEQAVAELRQGRGGEVWARTLGRRPPFEPFLREQLARTSDHRVVVGTLDDVVVGYGVARLDATPPPDVGAGTERLGNVTDLYVEPEGRGLGIGELMMQHLVDWCAERGCYGVDSLALPGDRATKNFFERFGLTARAILVHRRLE